MKPPSADLSSHEDPLCEQKRLRAEIRRLETLLAAVCQASLVLDPEGRVAAAQPESERLLGPAPLGSLLTSLVADTQELLLCAPAAAGDAAPPVLRLAGPHAHGLPAAALVRDADGRPVGVLREGRESAQARALREERERLHDALHEGRLRWADRWLPPQALLALATARVERLAAAKRVRLVSECAPGLPSVSGEPRLLAQALAELLSNALRHSVPGGEVRLRAEAPKTALRRVTFSVEDSGPGLPAGRLRALLRRRDERRPGEGLGLRLARAILERHGTRLSGHSRPGAGARVWFRLRARARWRPW